MLGPTPASLGYGSDPAAADMVRDILVIASLMPHYGTNILDMGPSRYATPFFFRIQRPMVEMGHTRQT